MTMPATTAHTGVSRLRTMATIVPPDWAEAARSATASSASTTKAPGRTAWTVSATSSTRAPVLVPGLAVTYRWL